MRFMPCPGDLIDFDNQKGYFYYDVDLLDKDALHPVLP